MTRQQLLKKYDALPPAARKEIDLLVTRLALTSKPATRQRTSAQDFGPGDGVFGMWQDREDMQDPVAWVRKLRRRQWGRRIGRSSD